MLFSQLLFVSEPIPCSWISHRVQVHLASHHVLETGLHLVQGFILLSHLLFELFTWPNRSWLGWTCSYNYRTSVVCVHPDFLLKLSEVSLSISGFFGDVIFFLCSFINHFPHWLRGHCHCLLGRSLRFWSKEHFIGHGFFGILQFDFSLSKISMILNEFRNLLVFLGNSGL